jgi:hypothetical protein
MLTKKGKITIVQEDNEPEAVEDHKSKKISKAEKKQKKKEKLRVEDHEKLEEDVKEDIVPEEKEP